MSVVQAEVIKKKIEIREESEDVNEEEFCAH